MSNILASLPPVNVLVRPIPAVMGIALTLHGINVAFNPSSALTAFGMDPTSYKDGPLIPTMASRNIALGLSFIFFWYLGMDVAAGYMMILGCIAPAVDAYTAEKWGRKGSGVSHIFGTVVSLVLGAAVVYYGRR